MTHMLLVSEEILQELVKKLGLTHYGYNTVVYTVS